MDVSTISDVKELKAMAYDFLAEREQAERNLQIVNTRLNEVLSQTDKEPAAKQDAVDGEVVSS